MARSGIGPRALRDISKAIEDLSASAQYFSQAEIAEHSQYSPRTVTECMTLLQGHKAVVRERVLIPRKGHFYHYSLVPEKMAELKLQYA